MTEVIGVRFKNGGKTYFFDPRGLEIALGTNVIIETARGIEFGTCTEANHEVEDRLVVQPLRPVVRIATPEDEKNVAELRAKEKRAFTICEEKIAKHGLDMKLVEVEYNFEGNKILFFFTSDGRVDFRELVKDLASVFRTRIELRQIGVRDEAKLLGGLGICGRPFCCSSFLEDFQPVSIKMAKTQNLSLNPTKISGTCGRLMCCLKYEQDAYEDLVRRLPKVNSPVETPDGPGVVAEVNLLREQVKVRFEGQADKKAYQYDSETKTCQPIQEKAEPESRFTSAFLSELLGSAPTLAESRKSSGGEGERREHRRKRGGKGGGEKAAADQSASQRAEHEGQDERSPAEPHKKSNHRRRRKKSGGGQGAQQSAQNKSEQLKQGDKSQQNRSQKSAQGGSGRPQQQNRQGGKPRQNNAGRSQGEKAGDTQPSRPQPEQKGAARPAEGGQARHRSNNKYRGRASNRPPKTDTAGHKE